MKRKLFFILTICAACNFLVAQEPKLIVPIGHLLGVSAAVFSPDGKRIVTTALDNSAKIWDVETGRLLANLRGHTDTLYSANFSPDGKKIVTTSEDGTAKIWDANSTLVLANLTGHVGKVFYAEFSPDGKKLVTTSENATAKIWDVASGKLIADLNSHSIAINYICFSPDGEKIITGDDDSTAKIWDAATGKLVIELKGHGSAVWTSRFSPNGKKVITGSLDSTAKIWEAESGKLLLDLKGHKAIVRFASFSPDGKRVLTGSDDGTAKIWNAENGNFLFDLLGKKIEASNKNVSYYPDIAAAANFTPDGKKIVTVYLDSTLKIWDATNGVLLHDVRRKYDYVNTASFSHDGKKFSLALARGQIEIYDVEKGKLLVELKGEANYTQRFELSPDGKRILVRSQSGSAKLIDALSGTLVAILPGVKNSMQGVAAGFSSDGKKVVTTDGGNNAKLYDAVSGILLFDLTGHKQRVFFPRFSADSKIIFTTSLDSTCKIWDAVSGRLLINLKFNSRQAVQVSPDGKRIIAFSQDNIATIWSAESGLRLGELIGHLKNIINASFSSDGKKIFTQSQDNNIKIWNAETWTLLTDIKDTGNIRHVIFNPDGKRILITSEDNLTKNVTVKIRNSDNGNHIVELKHPGASFDWVGVIFSPDGKKMISPMVNGSICIWDAETGAFRAELKGLKHPFNISTNCFSPDGKKIVAGGDDGIVKIWDIETGTLLADLKEHSFFINSATYSPDGKKIITVSLDYTAKVWDAETGTSLYTFIAVGKEDYLFLDKNNHFDGSEGARKLLYFTCGTEVIELDQVKDQLWVPNLAERLLNGETINAAKLSDLNICNLTPVVDTIEQSALQYRFRITPRLGGLGATIVYVNGIEVKRVSPQQLFQQKESYQLAINKSELQKFFVAGKENSITVKSLTVKNSISSRSVSINEKGNEKSTEMPNLYAVVVGVSDYKGEGLDLKFAAKDAIDMANTLDNSAKKLLNTDGKEHVFIYKVHTATGRDKFPEKNSIKQIFTEIGNKAKPNDILLIFFAGHGVVEAEKNQFYFLTADASNATVSGALKNVGIGTEELADWIKPQVMKAQKRILIFDACNSGQALKEIISFNNEAKNLLASRGDENGKQKKAIEKLNEKSGMFILSASASDQKAYEIGKYNQGALTYSLLKAIKEQPDILEDRQYLNISRWFGAAEKTVGELARETGTRQQPQVVSTANFNIGVVDDDVRNKIVLPFEKFLFTRSEFRNTELRTDNLKLRSLVDKELSNLSDDGSDAPLLFNPEYEGANVYSLSCDYTVAGNDVNVSAVIIKGGVEIKTKFEVKGKAGDLNLLTSTIVSEIKDWLAKSK